MKLSPLRIVSLHFDVTPPTWAGCGLKPNAVNTFTGPSNVTPPTWAGCGLKQSRCTTASMCWLVTPPTWAGCGLKQALGVGTVGEQCHPAHVGGVRIETGCRSVPSAAPRGHPAHVGGVRIETCQDRHA